MSSQGEPQNAEILRRRRNSALRAAWLAYTVMLLAPFAALAPVIISLSTVGIPPRPAHHATLWFVLTLAYLAVALPAALYFRRHLCRAYFRGEVVALRQYFTGMVAVWLSLEIGIILSIIGCYVSASLLPGLAPAVLAFMFFIYLWPSGEMMVSRVGHNNDPAIYEPPR